MPRVPEMSLAQKLERLLDGLVPPPEEWMTDVAKDRSRRATTEGGDMESLPCSEYRTLNTAWRKAMKWRQGLDDVLSVMLAVALSTEQVGDQLFLQVIGDAGGGKTRFCEAMLVSGYSYALEHLTGFHSGWKDGDGEDYSLLSRINRKTLITPEGDVLMSSPRFVEIMSQQRRIFDGTSGASFKNRKEDMRYTGLRTPWIIAGTPALMDTDQSRLGDRFLRVCVDHPDAYEQRTILRRVGYTALRSVLQTSDGAPESTLAPEMAEAYKLTGGYVDYLRSGASELLSRVETDDEAFVEHCADLAEFTANLRARPNPDNRRDSIPSKELPSRLTHQYVRLAMCMAVVLNRPAPDAEVMRRVRKVAVDTGYGQTLAIVRYLREVEDGAPEKAICLATNRTAPKTRPMLRFLLAIEVLETFRVEHAEGVVGGTRWRLTDRMTELWDDVMEIEN